MNIEVHYNVEAQDELDNKIGKLLCIPEWFSSMVVDTEVWASMGYAGTYWQPEELPNMEIENLVVTIIHNEEGHGIKITPKQSALIEHLIDSSTFEDNCWDCLVCSQEDVGDY